MKVLSIKLQIGGVNDAQMESIVGAFELLH